MDSNKYQPDFFNNNDDGELPPPIPTNDKNSKKDKDLNESDILDAINNANTENNKPKPVPKLPTRPTHILKQDKYAEHESINNSKKNEELSQMEMSKEEKKPLIKEPQSIPKVNKPGLKTAKESSSISFIKVFYVVLLLIGFGTAGYYYYINSKNLKEYLSIKKHVENITKEMSKLTAENNQLVEKVVKSKKEAEDLTLFKQKYDEEIEKNKKLNEENTLLRADYKNLEELVKTKKTKLKK